MTAFILQEGLLDPAEIHAIIADAPTDLLDFQAAAAHLPLAERPSMSSWLDRFNAGTGRLAA